MAFQVSPGVQIQEKDLTNIIPAVSTTVGAFAGEFREGPLDEIVTVGSEQELVETFGKPDGDNFEHYFSAANFLQYGNALRVVRATQSSQLNSTADGTGLQIKNTGHYSDNYADGSASKGLWAARTAGAWGNNLKVSICPDSTTYEELAKTTIASSNLSVGDTSLDLASATGFTVGDIINFGETGGYEYRVTVISSVTITFVRHPEGTGGLHTVPEVATGQGSAGTSVRRRWQYYDQVEGAPGTSPYTSDRGGSGDELHIVVIDEDGGITGKALEVVEVYNSLSKGSDAKTPQGDINYYADVIYNKSSYIYWMDHHSSGTNWGTVVLGKTFTSVTAVKNDSLSSGTDGSTVTDAQLQTAFEKFNDPETVDVSLIIAGPSGSSTHIDNLITIAENRKDAIVFASPQRSDVVNITSSSTQSSNVSGFFDGIRSSSYVVFDSGYKYQYDRYNDVYRYVPLNGDIAGLACRTDLIADSWWSPAGLNRGIIRGAVKLAFNPEKLHRDDLYRKRVNPVVTFPGIGTVLFGDKTGLAAPSAFDRINVRRLFIVLEKAISTAAKFQLFEFNDEFTRANFRNVIEPFLRDVQGRRGITDFLVVCDETNNPGSVIDRNEFVADIYVKPARSINFITLKFIATRTGVAFEEVAG